MRPPPPTAAVAYQLDGASALFPGSASGTSLDRWHHCRDSRALVRSCWHSGEYSAALEGCCDENDEDGDAADSSRDAIPQDPKPGKPVIVKF